MNVTVRSRAGDRNALSVDALVAERALAVRLLPPLPPLPVPTRDGNPSDRETAAGCGTRGGIRQSRSGYRLRRRPRSRSRVAPVAIARTNPHGHSRPMSVPTRPDGTAGRAEPCPYGRVAAP